VGRSRRHAPAVQAHEQVQIPSPDAPPAQTRATTAALRAPVDSAAAVAAAPPAPSQPADSRMREPAHKPPRSKRKKTANRGGATWTLDSLAPPPP
jgi:hypothetical protein